MKTLQSLAAALLFCSAIHALPALAGSVPIVSGTTYIVSIGIPNPNPAASPLTTTFGSVQVKANAAQQIPFQFPASAFSGCTQPMMLVIQDPGGAVVREGIVPCPSTSADETVGITPYTTVQAKTSLVSGTDPLSTLVSNVLVRNNLADNELRIVGTAIQHGINNKGGFLDHLKSSYFVVQEQIRIYQININAMQTDPNSGFYALMNADASAQAGSADDSSKRGKAATMLLQILLDAADGANRLPMQTDIPRDFIIEAFDAMGAIVLPELAASNALYHKGDSTQLSDAALSSIQATYQSAVKKLRSYKTLQSYSDAISILGASDVDRKQFTDAMNALDADIDAAYAKFESAAFNNDPNSANAEGSPTTINSAQTALSADMDSSFVKFQGALAVSDARMTAMMAKICPSSGGTLGAPGCPVLVDLQTPVYDTQGNPVAVNGVGSMRNWPIGRAILVDWISSVVNAKGSVMYNGTCLNNGAMVNLPVPSTNPPAACATLKGNWTGGNFASAAYSATLPSFSSVFRIGKDISTLQTTRIGAVAAAYSLTDPNAQMNALALAEAAMTGAIIPIAFSVRGTTDGTNALALPQQIAMVVLMEEPRL